MLFRFGLAVIGAVLFLTPSISSEEGEKSHNVERQFKQMKEAVMKEVKMALKKQQGHQSIEPLGKQLELRFRLEPLGKDDKPFSVSVATKQYGVQVRMNSRETTFGLQISGKLALVGEEKDRVGITFQSGIDFKKGDTTGHVGANGSAIVAIGGDATLAVLGEKTLMVSVKEIK